MFSLLSDYRLFDSETTRLLGLCGTLSRLSPTHQKLIAEIVFLRLFSLVENLISSVSTKVVCGVRFLDGSRPLLQIARGARSIQGARSLLQTYGRGRPRHQLKWTKAGEIKENMRYVVSPNDALMITLDRNGSFIDEMRRIRNRIAHNNADSRVQYREVVRRHYGACLNHITPGILLLAPRFNPCLLEEYVRSSRIFAKDIVRS